MRNVILIPARSGSKRLPGKHLLKLGYHTLIGHATITSALVKEVDSVYLSTNDHEIANTMIGSGVKLIVRPDELAQDTSSTLNAIKHAVPLMGSFTNLILVNACCPFTTPIDIAKALAIHTEEKRDVTVSMVMSPESHPAKTWVEMEDSVERWIGNGERMLGCMRRNAAIYIFTSAYIEQASHIFESKNIGRYLMPPERSIDINTAYDYHLAKLLYENPYHRER